MQLLVTDLNTGHQTAFIRNGIAGNFDVVYKAIELIRKAVVNKDFETFVKQLVIDENLNAYNQIEILYLVYEFVIKNVVYLQDIAGDIENIKTPNQTLTDGYGDCDDLSILIASMLGVLGFENVYLTLANYSPDATTFTHLYPVVYVDGERFVLDATLQLDNFAKVNNEATPNHKKEIPVFYNVDGYDGISGFYYHLKNTGQKVGRASLELVPKVTEFLPLGRVGSEVFATSATMLQVGQNKELSLNALGSRINERLANIIISLHQKTIAYDIAVSYANQLVSQLATAKQADERNYKIIQKSIKEKYQYIKDFETLASRFDNDFQAVPLNPQLTILTLLGFAGFGAFQLYKHYRG